MSWERRRRIPWEHVSGILLAGVFTGVSVLTPQYTLSLSRDIPVTAILLSVVFGALMTLIRRYWSPQFVPGMNGLLSVLYTLLIWLPFITSWYLFAWLGYPVWPAAIIGLSIPTCLLVYLLQSSPRVDLLYQLLTLYRVLFDGWVLISSLFFGYGVPLLSLFLYSQVTQQGFGPVVLAYLGPFFLGGAVLSGAIYSVILRSARAN